MFSNENAYTNTRKLIKTVNRSIFNAKFKEINIVLIGEAITRESVLDVSSEEKFS